MKFLTKTFSARKGDQAKVIVSQSTAVKLMSQRDLDKYRKCSTHTYWGGDFKETEIVFTIPGDGQWGVVVEKGTLANPIELEASVELVKGGGLDATPLPGGGSVPTPKAKQIEEPVAEVEEEATEEAEDNSSEEEEEAVVAEAEMSDEDEEENKD